MGNALSPRDSIECKQEYYTKNELLINNKAPTTTLNIYDTSITNITLSPQKIYKYYDHMAHDKHIFIVYGHDTKDTVATNNIEISNINETYLITPDNKSTKIYSDLLDTQFEKYKQHRKRSILVIIDNAITQKNCNDDVIMEFLFKSKLFNIVVIIYLNTHIVWPEKIKEVIDFVFIYGHTTCLKQIYVDYKHLFSSYGSFKLLVDKHTKKDNALILDKKLNIILH